MLEGIRPKNVVCPACGYHPDGVPISKGRVTCPECGAAITFDFQPVQRSRWARTRLALDVLGVVVVAGFAGVIGSQVSWKWAAVFVCSIGLVWGASAVVRRLTTGR